MSTQSSTDDMEIDSTPVTLQGEWPNKRRKLDNFESFQISDSGQSSEPHDGTTNLHQRSVTPLAPLRYTGATSPTSPSDPMITSSEAFQDFFQHFPDLRLEDDNPILEPDLNSGSQQFEHSGLSAHETRLNITESTQDSEAGSGDPMQIYSKLEVLRTGLCSDIRPNWQRAPKFSERLRIEWSAETVELFGTNIIKSVSKDYFVGNQYARSVRQTKCYC